AKTITGRLKAVCCLRHYSFLGSVVAVSQSEALLSPDILVFEYCSASTIYTIHLIHEYQFEGELSVDFRADGVSLFRTSFNVVPGYVVGSDETNVILVT